VNIETLIETFIFDWYQKIHSESNNNNNNNNMIWTNRQTNTSTLSEPQTSQNTTRNWEQILKAIQQITSDTPTTVDANNSDNNNNNFDNVEKKNFQSILSKSKTTIQTKELYTLLKMYEDILMVMEYSPLLVKLFEGKIQTTTHCTLCSHVTTTEIPFSFIELPNFDLNDFENDEMQSISTTKLRIPVVLFFCDSQKQPTKYIIEIAHNSKVRIHRFISLSISKFASFVPNFPRQIKQ
jgi:hypothetical protein